MPELPEVETIRRQIAPYVEGHRVVRAWADLPRITRPSVAQFVARMGGRRIERALRHGKQMYFALDSGEFLLIHLGMTGRLFVEPGTNMRVTTRHIHGIFLLETGQRVIFEDPRTFGELAVAPDLSFLDRLGWEPLRDDFDEEGIVQRLRLRRTAIKSALLDQSLIAGIGNIYADEICFLAGVHPNRSAASLSLKRLRKVVGHIQPVLAAAVDAQGATASPSGRYHDLFGAGGEFMPHAYGRTGTPCDVCRSVIRRGLLGCGKGARAYHYCPRCQR